METVKGLTTSDILKDAAMFIPPMRREGLGVTLNELIEAGIGKRGSIKFIEDHKFTKVKMRCLNGRIAFVFMPAEDAKEYTDWIEG